MRTAFLAALLIAAGFDSCALAQQPKAAPATTRGSTVLVSLFEPVYPKLARQANITGKVIVTVTVNKDGTTTAVVESGHPLLGQAALDSATRSQFECRECSTPRPYSLVYTFEQTSAGDCCTAFNAPQKVERESPATDAQGQPLTRITITTEHVCFCDPSFTVTKERVRSLKCLYLWRCTIRK